MPDLIISSFTLPAAKALGDAARSAGWHVRALDSGTRFTAARPCVYYGAVDRALEAAERFGIALLEPPLDLLARIPREFLLRNVEFGAYADLENLRGPTFVKPADALNKVFDAGIYSKPDEIREHGRIDPSTPILAAEPVEWNGEYRCFLRDGRIAAWSRYISFGRPVWKPFDKWKESTPVPKVLSAFCERLLGRAKIEFPPAFVMDIGEIEERGWAVVEFNPVWCSGLLGADPRGVLDTLQVACADAISPTPSIRKWFVRRSAQSN